MKKLILFLLMALWAQGAWATPTYVHGNLNAGNPITTVTLPSVNSGDLVILVEAVNASCSSTPTSSGYTFLSVTTTNNGGSGTHVCEWYMANAPANASTVTYTFDNAGAYTRLNAVEYSGVSTSSPLRNQNGATGNSTTAATSAITTVSGDLVTAYVYGNGNPSTITAGSGYTSETSLADNYAQIFEDKVTSSTSETPSATMGSTPWNIIGAAFIPSAAVATTSTTITGAQLHGANIN